MSMSSSSGNVSFQWNWNSPVIYLFGGFAVIFGVIGIALVFLVCCPCCGPEPEPLCECHTNDKSKEATSTEVEREPDILVIVAGEENPRYLAKPTECSTK